MPGNSRLKSTKVSAPCRERERERERGKGVGEVGPGPNHGSDTEK